MLTTRNAGALAAVMVAVLAIRADAGAQSAAPAEGNLAFEAATVKPAAPNALANRVMPTAPNRLSIPSMTLSWLIYTAYGDGGFNTAMPMREWNGACRSGTPMEEDDPALPRCFSGYRPRGISLDGATLFNVAELLSLPQARSLLGGLVSDQTGLKGRYTMDLDYQFPPDATGPSLSTVIQEQWGLRVVPGKGSFRLVVVENARMPVDN
jgi:hypothetical protein